MRNELGSDEGSLYFLLTADYGPEPNILNPVKMHNSKGGKGKGKAPAKRGGGRRGTFMDADGNEIDIKSLIKDVEFIGSSRSTWRERKELENRKVVSLGGKPPKQQRRPLSVAKVSMKKQKERDQKKLEEGLVLGRFGREFGIGIRAPSEKRKAEDRVLKSTEGHFSKGVLDVKHLLRQGPSQENYSKPQGSGYGNKKIGGDKKGGKGKKKGGKKR